MGAVSRTVSLWGWRAVLVAGAALVGRAAFQWAEAGEWLRAVADAVLCLFVAFSVVADVIKPEASAFRVRASAIRQPSGKPRYRKALEASFWRRGRA